MAEPLGLPGKRPAPVSARPPRPARAASRRRTPCGASSRDRAARRGPRPAHSGRAHRPAMASHGQSRCRRRAAIGVLAVAVAGVAMPDRAARRVRAQQGVGHPQARQDGRIIGQPQTETHQRQEVRPDQLVAGTMASAGWLSNATGAGAARRSEPVATRSERSSPRRRAGGQARSARVGPALDRGIPVVGELETVGGRVRAGSRRQRPGQPPPGPASRARPALSSQRSSPVAGPWPTM